MEGFWRKSLSVSSVHFVAAKSLASPLCPVARSRTLVAIFPGIRLVTAAATHLLLRFMERALFGAAMILGRGGPDGPKSVREERWGWSGFVPGRGDVSENGRWHGGCMAACWELPLHEQPRNKTGRIGGWLGYGRG